MASSESILENLSRPREGRKYFTLREAKRALGLVRRIATDIQETQAERVRLHGALTSDGRGKETPEARKMQERLDERTARLEELIRELEKIGVELKDPARGLLDFPAIHEGREILLCWKGGEATITHWHEIDGGFSGRRPVEELHDVL